MDALYPDKIIEETIDDLRNFLIDVAKIGKKDLK